jgi:hypothetical protein
MLPAGPLLWCFWGGVTYIETIPPETPAKGATMKVHIEMDMTPEEARAFMGLPDIRPMQQKMLDEMQARMKAAFDANDPEGMVKAWLPFNYGMGGADAFQKFQKAMWDSAAAMLKKDGK